MGKKEIEINPFIYHGPGCCHKCSSPLTVVDSEVTVMDLTNDGDPISEDTEIKCIGVCKNCGYQVKMIRWQGGYIPYTRASLIFIRGKLLEQLKNERPLGKNPLDKNEE